MCPSCGPVRSRRLVVPALTVTCIRIKHREKMDEWMFLSEQQVVDRLHQVKLEAADLLLEDRNPVTLTLVAPRLPTPTAAASLANWQRRLW